MKRGVKEGYKQSEDHIEKRVKNRAKWNGGHNLLTTEDFVNKITEHWPECPYDLSKVHYIRNDCKVLLVCLTHGEFDKWPSDVLNKSGCPKCSGNGFSKIEYIDQLVAKFSEYDFTSSVYINAKTDMTVICKEHGVFITTRNKLLNGVRCSECSKIQVLEQRIKSGRAKDPALLSEYEKYRKEVWKETNKSYAKHKDMLGERSRTKHLDHIYSIVHGFRDGISPVILGNIVNLRIIDAKENRSKKSDSHYSKEELIMLYEEKNK